MNCEYCHTNNRKFYCIDCIQEKLQKHAEEISTVNSERDAAISKASRFTEKANFIQQLIAEKNKTAMSIESFREKQEQITIACTKKRLRIKELQRQIAERRKVLEEIQKRSNGHQLPGDHTSQLKAWQRTHKMTVGTRRILVKEVTSLFELRPGVIEESEVAASPSPPLYEMPPFSQTEDTTEGKEDLYICGVTLPTRLIDVSKYLKEELNAPIGLVIHMLGLIVRYLGIKLPFMIFQKGIRPYIRMMPPNTQLWTSTRKLPLFLEDDDKNFKKFVVGMAMLNYNLAYLCYTQGVKIPVSQVANTLQSLMACCKAPNLGIQSHALYYQCLRDIEFPIEFKQVLRATNLRYRCGSLLDTESKLISNNELNDKYFKVRSLKKTIQRLGGTSDDEDDEEEAIVDEMYSALYLDSDDDDESSSNSMYRHKTQQQSQQQQQQNEAWSLVEVAPFSMK